MDGTLQVQEMRTVFQAERTMCKDRDLKEQYGVGPPEWF